ncbi:hypothetical protein [Streptomyces sp. NPDC000405]|uniref:hypothetical protein n=1 Tax=Streptomyces sp. NPDC000405 TaxID=3161033 RepID=UPI00398C8442
MDQAIRLSGSAWQARDIVIAQDVSGDGVTDLVFRSDASGRLLLRKGIAASTGGVDLNSLASAANSSGGADTYYTATGWSTNTMPFLHGTPDANGDGIPDIWSVHPDGSVRFHPGGKTAANETGTEVIGPNTWWPKRITIG